MQYLRFTLFFISLLLLPTNSRQIQQIFQMNQFKQTNGWLYLDKIVLRPGVIDIKLRTQLIKGKSNNKDGQIILNIIPDHRWGIQNMKKCENPIQQPIINHQLLLQGTLSITQHTIHITQQQLYYFILKDCSHKFVADYSNPDIQFKLFLQIINNGAYLGQEQDHWLIIPLIIGIGLWIILSDKYFLRNQFSHDPDYAKMILFGAVATNISSLMWRFFGYLIYRNIGNNYIIFHLIYLFMHSISQTMVLTLLILISMGWSLNYLSGPQLDIAFPILSFIAIINIILTLMTQLSKNTQHAQYHTYDTYTGSIIMIFRIVIGIGFTISMIITIRVFLKKFGILGLLYICSIPLVIGFVNRFISNKDRTQFVFITVEVIKTITNVCLMYMVSSSRSEYNKLCYKNASFLPNQTGLF